MIQKTPSQGSNKRLTPQQKLDGPINSQSISHIGDFQRSPCLVARETHFYDPEDCFFGCVGTGIFGSVYGKLEGILRDGC